MHFIAQNGVLAQEAIFHVHVRLEPSQLNDVA